MTNSPARMLAFLVPAVVAALLVAAPGRAADKPLTVVELFTSQGCSSCPPADRFLGELAKRHDLVALSEHVDYWDYIGWKDPFASPANTKRQHDYARTLGLRYVYTPQMVIQGGDHVTGSDRARVLEKIAAAAALPRVPVALRRTGGGVEASVAAAEGRDEAALWLVRFDRQRETSIKRGENGGRMLAYHNVVRTMTRIGTWTGKPLTVAAALEAIDDGREGCAVILQSLKTGRILGAARLDPAKS